VRPLLGSGRRLFNDGIFPGRPYRDRPRHRHRHLRVGRAGSPRPDV